MTDPEQRAVPEAAQAAFDAGSREYVQSNNEAAIEQFEKAISLHREFTDAHYMMGLALLRVGSHDRAVESLKKVSESKGHHLLREYAERKLTQIGAGETG